MCTLALACLLCGPSSLASSCCAWTGACSAATRRGKQWEAFRGRFKHDAAIWRRGKLVSDFQHGKRQPAWYSLNHKRRPNLEMVWRKGAIEWRALCRIPMGAELGFDYGDVQGCGFR